MYFVISDMIYQARVLKVSSMPFVHIAIVIIV